MRIEKTQLLSDVTTMLSDNSYSYFISYQGVSVAQFRQFRNDLRACNATCKVLKNTIMKKVYAQMGSSLATHEGFKKDTAIVFGSGDASAAAKVIDKFAKVNEKVQAKFGFFDGAVLTLNDVKQIAELPSREVLYAMFLGVLNAPASQFARLIEAYRVKIEGPATQEDVAPTEPTTTE